MKGQGVSEPTLGRLESDELVHSIMEGVLRTPQEHRRTLGFVRTVSVVAVGVLLVAGGLIAVPRLTSSGTTGGSALSTYHADGLRFDYPAGWTLTQSSTVIGATRIVAFVGTGEGAAECSPVAIPTGGGERLCSLFSASLALRPGRPRDRRRRHQAVGAYEVAEPFLIRRAASSSADSRR